MAGWEEISHSEFIWSQSIITQFNELDKKLADIFKIFVSSHISTYSEADQASAIRDLENNTDDNALLKSLLTVFIENIYGPAVGLEFKMTAIEEASRLRSLRRGTRPPQSRPTQGTGIPLAMPSSPRQGTSEQMAAIRRKTKSERHAKSRVSRPAVYSHLRRQRAGNQLMKIIDENKEHIMRGGTLEGCLGKEKCKDLKNLLEHVLEIKHDFDGGRTKDMNMNLFSGYPVDSPSRLIYDTQNSLFYSCNRT